MWSPECVTWVQLLQWWGSCTVSDGSETSHSASASLPSINYWAPRGTACQFTIQMEASTERKKKYIGGRKLFWTALLTGLLRSSRATNWPECLSSSSKELLHCKADSGETLGRRKRRRGKNEIYWHGVSHKDSHEKAGSWILMSNSGQQTHLLGTVFLWGLTFSWEPDLVRKRLRRLLLSLSFCLRTRKSNGTSEFQRLVGPLFLESPWLLHSELRHNLSAKVKICFCFLANKKTLKPPPNESLYTECVAKWSQKQDMKVKSTLEGQHDIYNTVFFPLRQFLNRAY